MLVSVTLADADESDGTTLLTFNRRPFTIKDLTGVRYQDAVNALKKLDRIRKDSLANKLAMDPATLPLGSDGDVQPVELYHHYLSGVCELFVRAQVFELFLARHPNNVSQYYDKAAMVQVIEQLSLWHNSFFAANVEAVERSLSKEQHRARIRELFPDSYLKEQVWNSVYIILSTSPEFYQIRQICVPWAVDGKSVPWGRYLLRDTVLRYHVRAEVERDKAKYIRLLERAHGRHTFKTYPMGGNTPLYMVGKNALLDPLVEEVMDSVEIVLPGVVPPPIGQVKKFIAGNPFPDAWYGMDLPAVVKNAAKQRTNEK